MFSDACCRISSVPDDHSSFSFEHITSSFCVSRHGLKHHTYNSQCKDYGSSIHLDTCSGFKMHCSSSHDIRQSDHDGK